MMRPESATVGRGEDSGDAQRHADDVPNAHRHRVLVPRLSFEVFDELTVASLEYVSRNFDTRGE
jgi:hypothetical protein